MTVTIVLTTLQTAIVLRTHVSVHAVPLGYGRIWSLGSKS